MVILMVQHKWGRGYEITVITLETALSIGARLDMLQEPFIGNSELIYCAFNFYCPQRDRTAIRVMTEVRKDLVD